MKSEHCRLHDIKNYAENNKTTTNATICLHLMVMKEEGAQIGNQNKFKNRRQHVLTHTSRHKAPSPTLLNEL